MQKIRSMIERFKGKYFYQEEEINLDQAREILDEARDRIKSSLRERELLEVMANTITGCVWIKSYDMITEEHAYEFANFSLCEKFLCLDNACLEDCTLHVRSKTDTDLINDFIERCHKPHSFIDICEDTDNHAVDQAIRYYHTNGKDGAKSSRYFEYGIIGDRTVLFNVVKTPLFREGEKPCWNTHTYLVGTSTEEGVGCDSFYALSKTMVAEGKATVICPGAIWIHPEAEIGTCALLEQDILEGKI